MATFGVWVYWGFPAPLSPSRPACIAYGGLIRLRSRAALLNTHTNGEAPIPLHP